MKCERCGADRAVQQYDVDGFTGRLCDECVKVWEKIEAGEAD